MSSLTWAIDGLEELLLASPTFVAAMDEPTLQDIRDQRIHAESIVDDNDQFVSALPAAAIVEADHRYGTISQGEGNQLGASGTLKLMLARPATNPKSHKQSRRDFVQWSSTIMDEIAAAIEDGNHYQFADIASEQPAVRTPTKERGDGGEDFWWCSYRLEWGVT